MNLDSISLNQENNSLLYIAVNLRRSSLLFGPFFPSPGQQKSLFLAALKTQLLFYQVRSAVFRPLCCVSLSRVQQKEKKRYPRTYGRVMVI